MSSPAAFSSAAAGNGHSGGGGGGGGDDGGKKNASRVDRADGEHASRAGGTSSSSTAGGGAASVKPPRGARDFTPEDMVVRERVMATVREVFRRHGAVSIDTPVFELSDTLRSKYGEDSKLIYDIAEHGGEELSLRYDLTVPFARYVANHNVRNMKRYHMARVYRRDSPQPTRGRYREFYQCDFDVAGSYPAMVADAEVIGVLVEVLETLAAQSAAHARVLGSFVLKLNHRALLDGVFRLCGVADGSLRAVSSAIDKLDKLPWAEVREEIVHEKGVPADVAERIGGYVRLNGEPAAVLAALRADEALAAQSGGALDELQRLCGFLDALGALPRVRLDLSLARGLDYYTGVIFEAVLLSRESSLGSVGAGGRYDGLVGAFVRRQVPCVGCSLGIERVMELMKRAEVENAAARGRSLRVNLADVLVGSVGAISGAAGGAEAMICERMRVCAQLWGGNVRAELNYASKPNVKRQLEDALERQIPLLLLLGEDELRRGVVQLKDVRRHAQHEARRDELVGTVHRLLDELAAAGDADDEPPPRGAQSSK